MDIKKKIIRYQQKHIKDEISIDGLGNSNFTNTSSSLFMAENNNGDVCISDSHAHAVVVVDKMGRVRFRTPAKRKKRFVPNGMVTDALGQIIVTDLLNNCHHVLDQNGQFLRCVDNCGLMAPCGLSVDSKGRLWVVCGEVEIKVIKYQQEQSFCMTS